MAIIGIFTKDTNNDARTVRTHSTNAKARPVPAEDQGQRFARAIAFQSSANNPLR